MSNKLDVIKEVIRSVNRKRIDNGKNENDKIMIYNTLHKK